MTFGETLAELRSELGITQEDLARRLFVTRQAVSRWERGDTTPGIDMLKLIIVAQILGQPFLIPSETPAVWRASA